jgi:hypothetical protein
MAVWWSGFESPQLHPPEHGPSSSFPPSAICVKCSRLTRQQAGRSSGRTGCPSALGGSQRHRRSRRAGSGGGPTRGRRGSVAVRMRVRGGLSSARAARREMTAPIKPIRTTGSWAAGDWSCQSAASVTDPVMLPR